MDRIVIHAPAKINLFLKVLAKRPDGYHTIETLFEKIALFDKIRLEKAGEGISLYSARKGLPKGRENLAYKAAELMRDRYDMLLNLKIEIEKSIPIGAGLGGGSSDGAAVLMGINRLYNMGLSKEDLEALAKELGADIPFFLSDETWAVGRERGDVIKGINSQMKLWHILVIPSFSVFSKDAYEKIDRKRLEQKSRPDIGSLFFSISNNDVSSLKKNLYNDLEEISFEREGLLKEFRDSLLEYGAKGALVSGSGPSLFGIAENREGVVRLQEAIRRRITAVGEKLKKWQVYTVPTISKEIDQWKSRK